MMKRTKIPKGSNNKSLFNKKNTDRSKGYEQTISVTHEQYPTMN